MDYSTIIINTLYGDSVTSQIGCTAMSKMSQDAVAAKKMSWSDSLFIIAVL